MGITKEYLDASRSVVSLFLRLRRFIKVLYSRSRLKTACFLRVIFQLCFAMKSYALKNALKTGHWPSLAGAWLHFEVSFIVWLLIGALGIAIAQDFALSATQKG